VDRDAVKTAMRGLPLFQGLALFDLERLVELSDTLELRAGATLMREGEPGDSMYLVITGELEIVKDHGERESALAVRGPGEVVGEMALLEDAPRSATVRALADSHLVVIGRQAFAQLLSCSPTAAPQILATVASRLRSTESLLMHQAKLAALGTMAAGLAHELNNPAAAIGRGVEHLRLALAALDDSLLRLYGSGLGERESAVLAELHRGPTHTPERQQPDVRDDHDIEAWLEGLGGDEAWRHAPALAAAGWRRATLEERLRGLAEERRADAARWLAARASADELLAELRAGAAAIASLVTAVRRYSYLDQAPVQEVDVHETLETTLTIMRHRLGDGIAVVRDYAGELSAIEARGGELNQVWTNLIDNAIAAMAGRGTLTIRTKETPHSVAIEIHDTGPGIPDEVRPRLFEPFFTTKGVGEGTGLGLHIAYTIVVQRHRGQLEVRSQPGATCFRVTLPRTPVD
jgi:signal transduction histidine kinase